MNERPWGADMAALVRSHPDSILVTTDNGKIVFANAAAMRLLCRLPDSFGYIPAVLDVDSGHSTSVSLIDLAGHEVHLAVDAAYIEWCSLQARALYIHDITDRVHEHRAIRELIHRDHLTGLYNRRGLEHLVGELIRSSSHASNNLSISYIDINGLKQVNDSLGHRIGDAMIQETAALLDEVFGDHSIKARIGGDEFVVLIKEPSRPTIEELMSMLRFTAEACNRIPGRKYDLSLSIGLVDYRTSSIGDFHAIIDQAESNMYRAKHRSGKGHFRCSLDTPMDHPIRVDMNSPFTSRPEASR